MKPYYNTDNSILEVERSWCADCGMSIQLVGIGGYCEHCEKHRCPLCYSKHDSAVCRDEICGSCRCCECQKLFQESVMYE